MGRDLSKAAAKELIHLVYSTNYLVSPFDDGVFETVIEAIEFVESELYSPSDCLALCFETTLGNWDSVIISQAAGEWAATDGDTGGKTTYGNTLLTTIESLRHGLDPMDAYCPVELTLKKRGK